MEGFLIIIKIPGNKLTRLKPLQHYIVHHTLYTVHQKGHSLWHVVDKRQKMLTTILFLAGLICFRLFFKCIDFFEKV